MLPPLISLAQTHLRHEHIAFMPEPARMRLAAVYTGFGLDHLAGEEPIVLVDESNSAAIAGGIASLFGDGDWDVEHYDGALVTTQRFILGGREASAFFLAGITGARLLGSLVKEVEVSAVDERGVLVTKKHSLEAAEVLVRFLSALAQVPPPHRALAPRASDLVSPTQQDPSGALAAVAQLGPASDPRAVVLLRAIGAMLQRGIGPDPASAADLARRAVLFERNERTGRGMRSGLWLSPLSPEDFEGTCHIELGVPPHRQVDPAGTLVLGFRYDSNLALNALDRAQAAFTGLGSDSPTSTLVDVRIVRLGAVAGFSLRAASGERFTIMPKDADMGFVQAVHKRISYHEARVLLLRVLFGWSASLYDLFRVPADQVNHRIHELLGPTDLTPFATAPPRPEKP